VDPKRFFRETFFTWSHTDLVHAVADRLAEAGGVDSYIWEMLRLSDPALTARTRVVSGSTRFGFPPIVAGTLIDEEEQRKLARVLLTMHLDPEGRELLGRLHLDRFIEATDDLYDSIPPMIQSVMPSAD
jgi:phosphonate transport system substrate-binding protein